MARSPRNRPPSALDGYRRLARTAGPSARVARTGAGVEDAAGSSTAPGSERARGRRGARIAGSLRLVGFVAVLAIIVATSVGLANADTRGKGEVAPTASKVADPTAGKPQITVVQKGSGSTPAAPTTKPTGKSDTAAKSDATTTAAPATGAAARASSSTAGTAAAPTTSVVSSATTTTQELPFTGAAPPIDIVLLVGASLTLFGMLVQIAGQPLPARSRRRAAAAQSSTS